MTETINMGDILATFVILGFLMMAIAIIVISIRNAGKKNNEQKISATDANARIEALEKRVEQLENER
ncbi:hypothetical protein [Planococcus dechangensis]|uniref:DUF4083 domain-containing protein n=1 Tax=Planococcus dechangensis TaxID=1176255 RepID=A0ABV9MF73_9BACL